jgi:hypothetical protein
MFNNETQELILKCVIAENGKNPALKSLPDRWYNLNWRIANGNF